MIVLHILLGILKIIGILLLILLALVLLTVLALLFAPVRYRMEGERTDSFYQGKITISWLMRLVWFHAGYDSRKGKTEYSVRILGISAKQAAAFFRKCRGIRQKAAEKKAKKKKSKEDQKKPEVTAAQEVLGQSDAPEITKTQEKISETEQSSLSRMEDPGKGERERQRGKKNPVRKFWENLKKILRTILAVPKKISGALKNFRLTAAGICDKIKQIRELWESSQFQGAKGAAVQETKGLLRHIKPRKLRGRIAFGTEDPCTTGEILAAAGIFYPLYGENLIIEPYFDKEILEGEIQAKGRICGICMAAAAFRLFRNQDIRFIIRKYKQH